ncbi:MAG: radical SAM family heme chaperone HemW [Chloroflexota bacterium]
MLSPLQVKTVISCIHNELEIGPSAEITIEAHPDTTDSERLIGFRRAGATRISFGAESLDEGELAAIGRGYVPERVVEAVHSSRRTGYDSVALDLMYGLPRQSLDSWKITIEKVIGLGPDHLSLYPLSIESGTVFARQLRGGSLSLPEDEIVIEMYDMACELLADAGFDHYEVANWAQPGHECRHNKAYWLNHDYYAVGVGAHGSVRPYRTVNIRQTGKYINEVMAGNTPLAEREHIGGETRLKETIMLGLRLLRDGLDSADIREEYGIRMEERYSRQLAELTSLGILTIDGTRLRIQESSVPIANEIWSRFM